MMNKQTDGAVLRRLAGKLRGSTTGRVLGWTAGLLMAGLTAAQAQVAAPAPAGAAASIVPWSAFYVGAGGAVNSATFPNQDVYGLGLSDITKAGAPFAKGYAAGNAYPYMASDTSISPIIQFGYFQHFGDTPWMWGAKFSYNYLGTSTEQQNFLIPQNGAYAGAVSGTLAGNVGARSYQMSVKNQMSLVPVVGYSFERSFLYMGAGLTLSQISSNLNGLVGFADIMGSHFDLTGAPQSFSAKNWVYGGTVVAGTTYFFAPGWFLDLNYSYTANTTKTNSFAAPFTTVHDGLTYSGWALGTYSGTADVQSLQLSINKTF